MHSSLHDDTWSSIVDRIGEVADLETTARRFGALKRVRKVRRAEDLLRLGLIYGPGHHLLRSTAAMPADGEIVSLSDKGVLGRVRKLGNWFEHLLDRLLEQNRGLDCGEGLNLSLVDGTLVCEPGSIGNDWRLHARFDPGRGRFGDLVLTRGDVAKRVDRTQPCFDEDRARNRRDHGRENLTTLRKLALNVLRSARPDISIRRKRKRSGSTNEFARTVLGKCDSPAWASKETMMLPNSQRLGKPIEEIFVWIEQRTG